MIDCLYYSILTSFIVFQIGADIKLKARKKINDQVFIVNSTLQISSDIQSFKKEEQLAIVYESLENSDPETALSRFCYFYVPNLEW